MLTPFVQSVFIVWEMRAAMKPGLNVIEKNVTSAEQTDQSTHVLSITSTNNAVTYEKSLAS